MNDDSSHFLRKNSSDYSPIHSHSHSHSHSRSSDSISASASPSSVSSSLPLLSRMSTISPSIEISPRHNFDEEKSPSAHHSSTHSRDSNQLQMSAANSNDSTDSPHNSPPPIDPLNSSMTSAIDSADRLAGEVDIPVDPEFDDSSLSLSRPFASFPTGSSSSSGSLNFSDSQTGDWTFSDIPFKFRLKTFCAFIGPGFLISMAFTDPGNIQADLQAGAYAGYQLLWILLVCTMAGWFFQSLASRLGVVTGLHLAQLCRAEYTRKTRLLLWIMTEMAIVGSDIQEVLGSSIAFKILFGLPLWAGVLITGLDTFTFLFLHYFGIRKLEAFFASLISTMCVCFFLELGYAQPPAKSMLQGLVPYVSSYAVVQAVGLVGAVIMPHNIYLHSALVLSRNVDRSRPIKVKEAIYYFSMEAAVAIIVSFFINAAIVSVFAHGFFDQKCAEDGLAMVAGKCQSIGLGIADQALHEFLGNAASTIWAIGLLASGQSSTMTGTYTGQFVMTGFLKLDLPPWKRVAITRTFAIGPAMLVSLFGSQSENSSDSMGEWLNVLQSMQLPFALIPLLHFTGSKRLMGKFANSRTTQVIAWTISMFVIATNFYLIASFVTDPATSAPKSSWFYALVAVVMTCYCLFLMNIIRDDAKEFFKWIYKYYLFYNESRNPLNQLQINQHSSYQSNENNINNTTTTNNNNNTNRNSISQNKLNEKNLNNTTTTNNNVIAITADANENGHYNSNESELGNIQ